VTGSSQVAAAPPSLSTRARDPHLGAKRVGRRRRLIGSPKNFHFIRLTAEGDQQANAHCLTFNHQGKEAARRLAPSTGKRGDAGPDQSSGVSCAPSLSRLTGKPGRLVPSSPSERG
jgi:hypothetical protein